MCVCVGGGGGGGGRGLKKMYLASPLARACRCQSLCERSP